MKMRLAIAIVDDDSNFRQELRNEVVKWGMEKCYSLDIDLFPDGESFLQTAKRRKYQVVFFDIYMAELDGIETARHYRQMDMHSLIIYTTSSSEHMPQAFSCHTFDYLLKPVDPVRLQKALEDAAKRLCLQEPYLQFEHGKMLISIYYSDIHIIVAQQNYCKIHGRENIVCRRTFSSMERQLCQDERFCVVNRGVLVNLDFVESLSNGVCRMKDGSSFPLNTRRATLLKQVLIDHRFLRRQQFLGGMQND